DDTSGPSPKHLSLKPLYSPCSALRTTAQVLYLPVPLAERTGASHNRSLAPQRRGAHFDPIVATVILGTHPPAKIPLLAACTRERRAEKAAPAQGFCRKVNESGWRRGWDSNP